MFGIQLNLSDAQKEIIQVSLRNLYEISSPGEKPIIKLVIKKFKSNGLMDGMYLRSIEKALSHTEGQDFEASKLKSYIQEKREEFQQNTFRTIRSYSI